MKNRTLLAKSLDRQLVRDLGFLFIATCFVLVQLFGYNWPQAVIAAPLGVALFCAGLYLLVQVSWLVMVGIDRLAARFGNNGRL